MKEKINVGSEIFIETQKAEKLGYVLSKKLTIKNNF